MDAQSVPFFVVFPLTLSATPEGFTTVYTYDHDRGTLDRRVGATSDGPLTLTRGWYVVISEPPPPAPSSPASGRR